MRSRRSRFQPPSNSTRRPTTPSHARILPWADSTLPFDGCRSLDGYYDVIITANTSDGFTRRYAGRIA
jgi:hypothetical protein